MDDRELHERLQNIETMLVQLLNKHGVEIDENGNFVESGATFTERE